MTETQLTLSQPQTGETARYWLTSKARHWQLNTRQMQPSHWQRQI